MPQSTITQADKEFVETWENIAAYQNGIIRLDPQGNEKQEVISGNRTFMLSTYERVITQDRVVDPKDDPFINGSFRPITVPEGVTFETNPNALSDDEIFDIFKSSDIAWQEYMKVIDSPATLNRMVDLADDDRAEGLTVRRMREVQVKLREVSPPRRLTSSDPQLQKFLDGERAKQSGPTTPNVPDPSDRRSAGGGRSRDYRNE